VLLTPFYSRTISAAMYKENDEPSQTPSTLYSPTDQRRGCPPKHTSHVPHKRSVGLSCEWIAPPASRMGNRIPADMKDSEGKPANEGTQQASCCWTREEDDDEEQEWWDGKNDERNAL